MGVSRKLRVCGRWSSEFAKPACPLLTIMTCRRLPFGRDYDSSDRHQCFASHRSLAGSHSSAESRSDTRARTRSVLVQNLSRVGPVVLDLTSLDRDNVLVSASANSICD